MERQYDNLSEHNSATLGGGNGRGESERGLGGIKVVASQNVPGLWGWGGVILRLHIGLRLSGVAMHCYYGYDKYYDC